MTEDSAKKWGFWDITDEQANRINKIFVILPQDEQDFNLVRSFWKPEAIYEYCEW